MRIFTIVAAVTLTMAGAVPASAELIFFAGGRSMSAAGHRFDGDTIVVQLRGGGEMTFNRQLVSKIAPDEVPYPAPPESAQALSREAGGPLAEVQAPDAFAQGYGGQTKLDERSLEVYASIIDRVSAQQGVDAQIVKAVIQVESGYQARARSPKGAVGLMQLMPATARQYGLRNPYDAARNIEAGTRYLGSLLQRFELPLALAAYNAGEAAVRRFGGIPPYPETQAYVARILSLLGSSL
jgi:soluble lytic murein transglycosylase-like protein